MREAPTEGIAEFARLREEIERLRNALEDYACPGLGKCNAYPVDTQEL